MGIKVDAAAFPGDSWPCCPHCGVPARPAILMFGDGEWVDDSYQDRRHELWVNATAEVCSTYARGQRMCSEAGAPTESVFDESPEAESTEVKPTGIFSVGASDDTSDDAGAGGGGQGGGQDHDSSQPPQPQLRLKVAIVEIGCGANVTTCRGHSEYMLEK